MEQIKILLLDSRYIVNNLEAPHALVCASKRKPVKSLHESFKKLNKQIIICQKVKILK